MVEHTYTNSLIKEKSPYLLQHAHNPVNWHPWGDEPFKIAKEKNLPVLVSIGYATCHWCHVMERESFEDPVLAEMLNENFVSIKVDREERPDVDSIYMQAVQALGQQGGWPLNVFLTPDGIPFYGGTYFPPERRYNLPSFLNLLQFLNNTWKNEQDKIDKQTKALVDYIRQTSTREPSSAEPDDLDFAGEDKTIELFEKHYDPLNHGFQFQQQNKFPPSMGLSLLLRHYHRTGHTNSLTITENTLKAMKFGGIYDQIGGGLSRYSTDYRWLVPHFEKMLYDNALFTIALIETYQVSGKKEFAEFANDLLQYIDRDMTSEEGAFFSAEDADSEGVEGKFYVWTQDEVEKILGRKTASVAIPYYNITPEGNFERKNILNVTREPATVAREVGMQEADVLSELEIARDKLLEARSQRIRPLLDDKILTSWNALMISAMAKTGRVLGDADRIQKSARAMEFILTRLRTPEGKLLRRYRDGEARYDGYLCDYTATATACMDLYEATYEPHYIQTARELMQRVEDKFYNENGTFHETASDGEELLVRQISGYDGVEPSGNSNAAMALLRLSAYLLDPALSLKAEKIFLNFNEELMEYGLNSAFMLQALHLYLGGLKEVAVVGKRNDPETQKLLDTLHKGFYPNAVFAFAYDDQIENTPIPLLKNRKLIDGKATAYVCRHGTCLTPVQSAEELVKLLSYD
ncbi:MAG: thioredoxin domain-containing protein [Nitrospinae bacterium]|nr:thioredoxin domain-containing protein [Nitrospinota bacterium]MBL7021134.1 thioredoxin domain-containing protein [Nitrospinaceae bacterium]